MGVKIFCNNVEILDVKNSIFTYIYNNIDDYIESSNLELPDNLQQLIVQLYAATHGIGLDIADYLKNKNEVLGFANLVHLAIEKEQASSNSFNKEKKSFRKFLSINYSLFERIILKDKHASCCYLYDINFKYANGARIFPWSVCCFFSNIRPTCIYLILLRQKKLHWLRRTTPGVRKKAMTSINFSYKKFVFIMIACIFHGTIQCREKIAGDMQLRDGNSFSFSIKTHYAPKTHRLYVGAQEAGTGKDFALCYLEHGKTAFKPFAPEKIVVNKIEQINPIYNAGIRYLEEIDPLNLALVLAHEPADIFVINFGIANTFELFSASNILDSSHSKKNGGIVSCATFANINNRIMFAAIKGNEEQYFGDGNSGIAIVSFNQEIKKVEVTEKDIEAIKKELKDASEEVIQQTFKNIKTEDGKKIKEVQVKSLGHIATVPFSKCADFLKIGNNLTYMDDCVDMHWSASLERLYVALRVKGGEHETDGARAIAVGHFNERTRELTFYPIVNSAILAQNIQHIVGGVGPDAEVCIHKVRTMQTTTGLLDYLIVQGGNGDAGQTRRTVFALPLLQCQDEKKFIKPELMPLHGTLASVKPEIIDGFRTSGKSPLFLGRHFCGIPKDSTDIYTAQNVAAQVGAGPLYVGPINDIFVKDDAVYAVVTEPDERYASGVYRSQAIFDQNGSIAAWTAWQKAIDHQDALNAAIIDATKGSNFLMSGNSSDSIRTVEQMGWDTESGFLSQIARVMSAHLPKENGGIQELVDFSILTPGLRGNSLLCATGFSRVALAQTNLHDIAPECMVFKNGLIDGPIDPMINVIGFEGGDLEKLGSITAAEIGVNSNNGWLFVGGVHGLAVLCNADGSGWQMPKGLGAGFDGLQEGMAFKRIGDYKFVRKIIYDSQNLYILTDTTLDRINLNSVDFCQPMLHATRLATADEIIHGAYAIFHDMIVSEKLCVIAHNTGLSRSGDDRDIRHDDAVNLNWLPVSVPGVTAPVVSLMAVSVSGRSQDCARFAAGQLYVISGFVGKNSAQVNRFVIHNCVDGAVSDETLAPLNDFAVKGKRAPFVSLGAYSSLFTTDGSMFFTAINRKKAKSPALLTGFGQSRSAIPIKFDQSSQIARVIRSSAFGNWLVAGDFGLLVND